MTFVQIPACPRTGNLHNFPSPNVRQPTQMHIMLYTIFMTDLKNVNFSDIDFASNTMLSEALDVYENDPHFASSAKAIFFDMLNFLSSTRNSIDNVKSVLENSPFKELS